MKKKKLLFAFLALTTCGSLFAQDAIHGVDGYYNFTPNQMKSAGILNVGNNGKKLKGYERSFAFTDDMKYVKLHMGVNGATPNDQNRYGFRSELKLSETAANAGFMTVTSAYPVVAFKFSMPYGDENESLATYFEPEFSWVNPNTEDGTNPGQTSGNKKKVLMNGLDNNGRYRFAFSSRVLKDSEGRDSIRIDKGGQPGNSTYRIANTVVKGDTIWHVVRITPKDGEMAEVVVAMDFSSIGEKGVAMLDTTDVKLKSISLGFLSVNAKLQKEDGTDKTLDELPTVYLKWLKTFPSMADFDATLNDENNWGDGIAVDPYKDQLNSEIYQLKLMMANYQFSDKLEGLQSAYDAALAVYKNGESTTADYQAQVEAIAAAKNAFTSSIVFGNDNKMNKIINLSGLGLGLSTNNVQVGGYTGKALELVEAENAADFLFTATGQVNGQTCYSLKCGSLTMVQASDGTLVFVDPSQLTTSNVAQVVLSNRGTVENPGYDFKVGKYYYRYDDESGEFGVDTEVPTVEDYDELQGYLYYPQISGAYDVEDHDATNYPMTSGEGSLFEFNGTLEHNLEPAYEASFNTYNWDDAVKATATKRATLPYAEGWSTNGWRMATNVDMTTLETGEKVMKLNLKQEYDDIHNDSVNVFTKTTDFTTGQSISIMREHGKYYSALNRVPQPGQLCDSLYAINLNSGINRYFAMKMSYSNPAVKFGGIDFFVRKNIEEPSAYMGNLLEKRGDVYIWDLLEVGIPYGDRKACAQYMSWNNCTSENDIVYVDWMRFYDSLDAIPTESLTVPTAIKTVNAEEKAVIGVSGNTVHVSAVGDINVFDGAGRTVKTVNSKGNVTFSLQKGMYLIQVGSAVKKVVIR